MFLWCFHLLKSDGAGDGDHLRRFGIDVVELVGKGRFKIKGPSRMNLITFPSNSHLQRSFQAKEPPFGSRGILFQGGFPIRLEDDHLGQHLFGGDLPGQQNGRALFVVGKGFCLFGSWFDEGGILL